MCTAYDVMLETRKRGGNVRHHEARDRVHELFQRGLNGGGISADVDRRRCTDEAFLDHD